MGLGRLKEKEAEARAAAQARQQAEAAKQTQAAELMTSLLKDGKEVSLPDALDVLSTDATQNLQKAQLRRIRKPVIDAVVGSELLRGEAVFVSGIPAGTQEQSLANGIAGRFINTRVFSVQELARYNPARASPKPETIIVYGFPTDKDRIEDASKTVLTAREGLTNAREKEDNKGRIIVLSNKAFQASDSPKAAELAAKFKFGHLTREGVRAY